MGHSFGLPRSSGSYNQTYDSDWDPMSDGSVCSPAHVGYGCVGVYTNAYHMDELLGWIPPARIWIPPARKYTATSASDQSITLELLGAPDANGAYLMAQIPIAGSTTQFYVVEAMRFTGYDAQIPGEAVVIHKVDTTLSDRNAKVVDATSDGDPNDAGEMWLPGRDLHGRGQRDQGKGHRVDRERLRRDHKPIEQRRGRRRSAPADERRAGSRGDDGALRQHQGGDLRAPRSDLAGNA